MSESLIWNRFRTKRWGVIGSDTDQDQGCDLSCMFKHKAKAVRIPHNPKTSQSFFLGGKQTPNQVAAGSRDTDDEEALS